jgi:hypothetical protein
MEQGSSTASDASPASSLPQIFACAIDFEMYLVGYCAEFVANFDVQLMLIGVLGRVSDDFSQ